MDADGRNGDLWLLDLSRAVASRFTFDPGSDYSPVWSPDGNRIAYGATRKEIAVHFGKEKDAPVMHILLYVPNAAKKPVPSRKNSSSGRTRHFTAS